MAIEDIKVPNIGDFDDVPVISIMVAPGDSVAKEDPLIELESDKATMEVPSPVAGKVVEIKVKEGDTVSEGSLILTMEVEGAASGETKQERPKDEAPKQATAEKSSPTPSPAPAARTGETEKGDVHGQFVVLGSGPGGYTAAFRAADLGLETVLIERDPVLGGVCLNVGCIPSKALLHAAKVITETEEMSEHGLTFAGPEVNIDALRGWKSSVVKKLTGGLE
ncbi:MAG TPA: biotin/lipoyl-containing protein, partial [Hyphomicrobiales bacterium]|nr:biotin/lipoyl-containing protein [Hyphomicrobiales bacterium]